MAMTRFHDRIDAGRRLARELSGYAGRDDVLVLGLPRGGVPVAAQVARALGAPLDAFLVRKLGVPGQEEFAMGAIASGGIEVRNVDVIRSLSISEEAISRAVERESRELERREAAFRDGRDFPPMHGKVVILVDDGLATGATMRAAVRAVRARGPARVVVAVPVGAPETCALLRAEADEVICGIAPSPFEAVGMWYENFTQTTDAEVREALR
jgi:putative phosphoribosyl transferase